MLSQFASWRAVGVSTALAVVLFLPPSDVRAQDKDAEIARLKKENADLAVVVAEQKRLIDQLSKDMDLLRKAIKDKNLAVFETEIKRYRNDAVYFEELYKTSKTRNENLLEQLRGIDLRASPRVIEANPPGAKIDGKIEKVDGKDLFLINVGTDHGVAKGHTLHVYRTNPAAKYLGVIRVIDANHDKSVARLVPGGIAAKIVEGDLVTSSLSQPDAKMDQPKSKEKLTPTPRGLKGAIEKIDPKDATLVTVSLGADAGLAKGHTLDVFGFRPDAKNLGSIRILEVAPRSAIARRLGSIALEVGDEVVSPSK